VVEYISQHGVAAEIVPFQAIDRVTGAGLLAAAERFGADLMSMGAYSSSSRLRQLILGGTTRHVLENATLPVLMNR
jgi:nucleotide-binding universal stress UspA family protein